MGQNLISLEKKLASCPYWSPYSPNALRALRMYPITFKKTLYQCYMPNIWKNELDV